MKFNNLLDHYIKNSNITKTELAKKLNVSTQYVVNLTKGRDKPPTSELLEKVCEVLKLDHSQKLKLFELAYEERSGIKDYGFYQVLNSSSGSVGHDLTKEIQEALKNPIAVKALLMTHSIDKKSSKTMEEALKVMAEMTPEKLEALLKLVG